MTDGRANLVTVVGPDLDAERRALIADEVDAAARIVELGIHAGTFAENNAAASVTTAMADLYGTYRAAVQHTLEMFVPGEEDAAFWTQVELYSGFVEPAYVLHSGEPLTTEEGGRNYVLPRSGPLRLWAEGGAQPVYAHDSQLIGDTSRHELVPPMSAAPPDMIWAPILGDDYSLDR